MAQWESANTTFYLVHHLFLCKIHVIYFISSAMFQNIFPEIINIVYFYLKGFFFSLINFLLIESSFFIIAYIVGFRQTECYSSSKILS